MTLKTSMLRQRDSKPEPVDGGRRDDRRGSTRLSDRLYDTCVCVCEPGLAFTLGRVTDSTARVKNTRNPTREEERK